MSIKLAQDAIQRLCWNEAGWTHPTGSCTRENGYPRENGFGHEEWNFCMLDAFDGHIHGYVFDAPKRVGNGPFSLWFWALEPKTRRRLLVGVYKRAQLSLVSVGERQALLADFRRREVDRRRAQELQAAVPSYSLDDALTEVRGVITRGELCISCPVEDVEVFATPKELGDKVGEKHINVRFANHTYGRPDLAGLPAVEIQEPDNDVDRQLAEGSYQRATKATLRTILRKHNALMNDFKRWVMSHNAKNVLIERARVDIRFTASGGTYLAELKTTYGVGARGVIREALGQLLEYNLYPRRKDAQNWMVVLDAEPEHDDKSFVRKVAGLLARRLILAWRQGDEFAIDGVDSAL